MCMRQHLLWLLAHQWLWGGLSMFRRFILAFSKLAKMLVELCFENWNKIMLSGGLSICCVAISSVLIWTLLGFDGLVKCLLLVLQVLESYNEEVMYVYDNYFKSVAKECRERMGEDDTLPLSGTRIVPREPFIHNTEGIVNCNYQDARRC